MDDIYQALIGGAPTDPQKQAALAEYLRQQQGLGRVLSASGDRVIAPLGENMSAEAMRGAQSVSGERERQANLEMMLAYRQAQEANMIDKLKNNIDVTNIKGDTARDVAAVRASATTDAAAMRAQNQKPKQLSAGERKELEQMADTTESLRGVIHDFKPEYAGVGTGAKNWMAQYGLGLDRWKAAQDWWARYNREFSLQEIHRQFGARFTAPEQQRFEAAHVNPNMDANQVQEKLQNIEPRIVNMVRGRIHDYSSGNYDPEYLGGISQRLGITDAPQQVPAPTGRGPHGPAASFPSGSAPAPYSVPPAAGAGAAPPPVPPAMRYLKQSMQVPAYMLNSAGPQPMAPNPMVRPSPPQGNLFQGLGGIPGG